MKTLITLTLTLALTGCGAYGNPIWLGEVFDRNDPCQLRNNHGVYPDFCGASKNRTYIYSNNGSKIGYIKQ